jgi:uncharacterized protein YhdP
VVGAAVIVRDKLLEGRIGLNEMGRKQYTVTGPWAEPVIKPLKTAADKNKRQDKESFE